MPAKAGGVITPAEARRIMTDQSTMKTALIFLQVEAGDRVDDARFRNPNQTDTRKGHRRLPDDEWEAIRAIVRARGRDTAAGMTEAAVSVPVVWVLPDRPSVTHALDCPYVKGQMNGPMSKNNDYVQVPVSSIGPNRGRCRICGGGR